MRQKIGELDQQIAGLEAQAASKAAQLVLVNDRLEGLQALLKKGLVPKPNVLAVESSREDLTGSRAQIESQISVAKQTIDETETQIIQSEHTFQEDVAEKLRQVMLDAYDISDRMAAMQHSIDKLKIRSPIAGQVVGLAVHTIGGVVSAGENLMDIVPVADKLEIDAKVSPTEINYVKVGLPAEVRLSALRQRVTPTLHGKVISVSTDVLVDAATHRSYYAARIEIPKAELDRLGDSKLLAGMPAQVLIKNGERTVLNYVIGPLKDAIFSSFHQD